VQALRHTGTVAIIQGTNTYSPLMIVFSYSYWYQQSGTIPYFCTNTDRQKFNSEKTGTGTGIGTHFERNTGIGTHFKRWILTSATILPLNSQFNLTF